MIRRMDDVGTSLDGCHVAFSPDGKRFVLSDLNGGVGLWDAGTMRLVRVVDRLKAGSGHPVFSPDGRYIAAYGCTGGLCICDADGELLRTTRQTWTDGIISFSPDSKMIAGLRSGSVIMVDVASGEVIKEVTPATPGEFLVNTWFVLETFAFSPDGEWLAGGTNGGRVVFWDTGGWLERKPRLGHSSSVRALAFSPVSKLVASCGYSAESFPEKNRDPTLKLWDMESFNLVRSWRDADGKGPGTFGTVAWSPDGRLLAAGDSEGTLLLWDMFTGESRGMFTVLSPNTKDHACIEQVAFSPDGRYIATVTVSGRQAFVQKVYFLPIFDL